MPATKVGIIYSLNQLVRREVILVDDDAYLNAHNQRIQKGEGWLEIPIDVYKGFSTAHDLDAYLVDVLGEAQSDICAIVDGDNNVVAVVGADPRIDQHPDGIIIQDDAAITGAVYDFENQKVIQS